MISPLINAQQSHGIVPIPSSVETREGCFEFNSDTRILVDRNNELEQIAQLLADRLGLSSSTGIQVSEYNPLSKIYLQNCIILTTFEADTSLNSEGYSLDINPTTIKIKASTAKGIFYGMQTLFQLMPTTIAIKQPITLPLKLNSISIKDSPRFSYRGLHLDVGRHMYPVSFIKKYIDLMAMYKLNTFHWHLTEDQGWRLEIKKHPLLTKIGSVRNGTQIGKSQQIDSIPYGGFYTQDEAREIVKYASSRFITVIPEIEMPGHSVAALTAYPELSCTGGPFEVRKIWGVSDDIYCAGNENVFTFIEDVLAEVMEIFPSTYIHIGGDEAPHDRWANCQKCQQRIKNEGLNNEAELQSYFIKRIEKFLNSKGRKLIGWDEILEGGLAPDATVMAWRGIQAGIDAANQQHDVIMTPVDYCYFDYYQGDPTTEPQGIGGNTTLKTVYSYNPVPPVLSFENAKHIIGVQGNVWTEYVKTPEAVEFKAFPRAIALAEVAWSQQENRNWDNFLNRLDNQLPRLDEMKVKYSRGSFNTDIASVYNTLSKNNQIVLSSETKGLEIRYTLDNTEPNANSKLYTTPFEINASCIVKAAVFKNDKIIGPINTREFVVSKAYGKPVTIILPYSFKYPGSGNQAMTDGLLGTSSYKSGWQGYEGTDMLFTVDLQKETSIELISIGVVSDQRAWVLFPNEVTFEISSDGISWKTVGKTQFDNSKPCEKTLAKAIVNFKKAKARYIKVNALSPRVLPEWHQYKGQPNWIFFDEIIVE